MYSKNLFTAGALLSVVAAVPMVKRDVVWVTATQEDVVTIPVTTTVWVNPGETLPTEASSISHFGHHHHSSVKTTHAQSTVTVPAAPSPPPPASSEESSAVSSVETSAPPAPSSYVAPTTSTIEAAPTTPSSTSVYVAPTTAATSETVAPSPTSTWVAPTTTSEAPAATTTASTSNDSGSTLTGDAAPGTEYSGDLTWYDVGLGACGITSSPSDKIVAIAESLFDEYTPTTGIHAGNPNMNALCGQTVTITGTDGSPYTATIVDRCGGCKKEDLDLSQDFFNAVTNNGDGRVHNMSWKFD